MRGRKGRAFVGGFGQKSIFLAKTHRLTSTVRNAGRCRLKPFDSSINIVVAFAVSLRSTAFAKSYLPHSVLIIRATIKPQIIRRAEGGRRASPFV